MSSRSPSSERKSDRSMRTRSRTPEMEHHKNGSPDHRNGSRSPMSKQQQQQREDRSPRKSRSASRSPMRKGSSRSPARKSSRSPQREGSRSPRRSSKSPKKDRKKSRSPGRKGRSRSPKRRSRSRRGSRSPRRSRSPRSRRRRRSSSSSGGRRRRSGSSSSPSYRRRRSSSRGRYSRSPVRRSRPMMDRDNPPPSNVLGVFGLSYSTDEHDLNREFSRFGSLESIRIVRDPERRSRGFGFIDFKYMEDAKQARRALCDTYLDGKKIRVDYSLTKEPHGRTPGRYLGGGTWRSRRRSRSYSPRRY